MLMKDTDKTGGKVMEINKAVSFLSISKSGHQSGVWTL